MRLGLRNVLIVCAIITAGQLAMNLIAMSKSNYQDWGFVLLNTIEVFVITFIIGLIVWGIVILVRKLKNRSRQDQNKMLNSVDNKSIDRSSILSFLQKWRIAVGDVGNAVNMWKLTFIHNPSMIFSFDGRYCMEQQEYDSRRAEALNQCTEKLAYFEDSNNWPDLLDEKGKRLLNDVRYYFLPSLRDQQRLLTTAATNNLRIKLAEQAPLVINLIQQCADYTQQQQAPYVDFTQELQSGFNDVDKSVRKSQQSINTLIKYYAIKKQQFM